ncbi:hypothetical protein [Methanocalculus sp.]|uniref:hypothetical protein n=1 Tax=Methanocalculus sp. TaxID=2004547 RepID=UPI00351CCFFE
MLVTPRKSGSHPEDRHGFLAITWEDDGPGIAVEQKEQIFTRGFGKKYRLGALFLT